MRRGWASRLQSPARAPARRMATRFLRYKLATTSVGLLSFVLILGIVELAIEAGLLDQYVVPRPSAVLVSFARLVSEEQAASRIVRTLGSTLLASFVAVSVGIPVGFILQRYR